MLARAAVVVTVLVAAGPLEVRAQGVELTSSGLTLGPARPFLSSAELSSSTPPVPLVLDPQGRLIRMISTSGGTQCVSIAGATPQVLNEITPLSPFIPMVGAQLSSDRFLVVTERLNAPATFDFVRGGCGVASTSLGSAQLTGSVAPGPRDAFSAVSPVLSNGDFVYGAPSGLVKVSFPGSVPTPALWISSATLVTTLEAVALPIADAGSFDLTPVVIAVGATPDDHVWAVVERRWGNAAEQQGQRFVVEIDPAGSITVRHGPDPVGLPGSGTSRAIYDSAMNSMLLGIFPVSLGPTTWLALGVQPLASLPGGKQPPLSSWPRVEDFNGTSTERLDDLVPSMAGHAVRRTRTGLRKLGLSPGGADFDRDGLRASQELAGGTSDFLADTDGDGVTDGLERNLYGTDPTLATSVPQVSPNGGDVILAPTLLPGSWELGPDCPLCMSGPENRFSAGLSSTGVMCVSPVAFTPYGGGQCFDRAGDFLVTVPGAPRFSPDSGFVFYKGDVASAVRRADVLIGGQGAPISGTEALLDVMALSDDAIIGVEEQSRRRLVRFDNGQRFTIIDLDRTPCTIVASEDQLAACSDPENAWLGVKRFDVVGFDSQRRLALVVVATEQGEVLLGVGPDRVVHLGGLGLSTNGLSLSRIATVAGGFVAQALEPPFIRATLHLDELFRPVPSSQRTLNASGDVRSFGSFYRNGFTATLFESYLIEQAPPGQSMFGCNTSGFANGSITICGGDFNLRSPVSYVLGAYAAEWVPVAPAIARGETIIWAASNKNQGRNFDVSVVEPWALWRMTPVGATAIWMSGAEFTRRLDAAGQASVATTALGPITAMGASLDGTKLCLAEPAAGRLWELTLDATTRRLASISLQRPAQGVTACAYDENGRLAFISKTTPVLRTADGEVSLSGIGQPRGLLRSEGRWVVMMDGGPARCVDSSGAESETPFYATAMSEALGRIAYLDPAGLGYLTTAEAFCTGKVASELLHEQGRSVWMAAYERITYRSVNSSMASMVVRPDGVMLVGAQALQFGGLGDASDLAHPLLFFVFPTYLAESIATRTPAADPFRAKKPRAFIAAHAPGRVHSMVVIPGASSSTDFGHLVRPTPAPTIDGPGSEADGGVGTPKPPGAGCGCSGTGELAVWTLLAAAMAARRARRPGSPARGIKRSR